MTIPTTLTPVSTLLSTDDCSAPPPDSEHGPLWCFYLEQSAQDAPCIRVYLRLPHRAEPEGLTQGLRLSVQDARAMVTALGNLVETAVRG